MRCPTESTFARRLLGIVAILACWCSFPALPAKAQSGSQGQNAVYNNANTVVGSSAFIDASMFATSPPPPVDFCKVLNYVLTHGYPAAGAVIDARGIPGITPAVSMTCTASPWAGITNPPPSTILLPATSGISPNPPNPIIIPGPWVLPANTHLIGEGDGIPSSTAGTTIQVAGSFSG
jgi:hypothetical protein